MATHRDLISVDPEDDLLSVVRTLQRNGIHHLPVLDADQVRARGRGRVGGGGGGVARANAPRCGAPVSSTLPCPPSPRRAAQGAVLAVLSYRSLLLHLVSKFTDASLLPLLSQPLISLGVGSYGEDIFVVPETASVVSVLHVLAERHVSSVPIVSADGSGVLVDIYCREDVAFLANDPSLMVLDAPVGDVRRAQISMVSGARARARARNNKEGTHKESRRMHHAAASLPYFIPFPSRARRRALAAAC
jgi:hypothetical protein